MKTSAQEKYLYTPIIKNNDAIPLWFCYPATYPIAMASLGFLHLFRLFDENPDVLPERVYTDTEKTNLSIKDVEILGMSFSFEIDILGILKLLEKYQIPFYSKDRSDDTPLVFAGGPVLTANPEPFADFFDFIVIGEGEDTHNELIQAYKEVRHIKSKKEKLQHIAKIEGIYVPSLYNVDYNKDLTINSIAPNTEYAPATVNKRHIKKLHKSVSSPIISEKSVFSNNFLVEVARGCPKRCRFCIASYLTLPARYPLFENIIESIEHGLNYTNKIGLLGALITEHPDFEKLCEYLLNKRKEKEFEISVSSLRVDTLTPLIVKTLVECGQKTSTISIEAGSERLRTIINKNLTENAIATGVKIASSNGLSGLKVYGMIGLPDENEKDLESFVKIMTRLKTENKGFNLTLSTSSFVPKAQTPFQWLSRESNETLEEKNNYLRKQLNMNKISYKPTSIKWDYIQSVISRGDRRLAPVLIKFYQNGGTIGSFTKAYKECLTEYTLPNPDWYALRERSFDEVLPWDIINSGLSKQQLKNDLLKSHTTVNN